MEMSLTDFVSIMIKSKTMALRLSILSQVCLAILLIASGFVSQRENVWGFDWFWQVPLSDRILAVLLVTVFVGLVVKNPKSIERSFEKIRSIPMAHVWSGVVVFSVLWLLRSHIIYGDGGATVRILAEGEWINTKEPLDRFLTAFTYHVTHATLGWVPESAIALVSVCGGIIFFYTLVFGVKYFVSSPVETLAFFIFMGSTGAVQVFFGNIENYSLVMALIGVFLVSGLAYLKGNLKYSVVAFIFALMAATHLSAFFLGPAFALLPLLRHQWNLQLALREYLKSLAPIACVFVATSILVYWLGDLSGFSTSNFGGGDGELWVPLFEKTSFFHKYVLFSPGYVIAHLNHLLLILSSGLVLLATVRRRKWTPSAKFLGIASLFTCGYMFFFNPDMAVSAHEGILNEWDLLAIPVFPMMFLSLRLFLSSTKKETDYDRARILAICSSIPLINTLCWIFHNARG